MVFAHGAPAAAARHATAPRPPSMPHRVQVRRRGRRLRQDRRRPRRCAT